MIDMLDNTSGEQLKAFPVTSSNGDTVAAHFDVWTPAYLGEMVNKGLLYLAYSTSGASTLVLSNETAHRTLEKGDCIVVGKSIQTAKVVSMESLSSGYTKVPDLEGFTSIAVNKVLNDPDVKKELIAYPGTDLDMFHITLKKEFEKALRGVLEEVAKN